MSRLSVSSHNRSFIFPVPSECVILPPYTPPHLQNDFICFVSRAWRGGPLPPRSLAMMTKMMIWTGWAEGGSRDFRVRVFILRVGAWSVTSRWSRGHEERGLGPPTGLNGGGPARPLYGGGGRLIALATLLHAGTVSHAGPRFMVESQKIPFNVTSVNSPV